MGAGRDGTTNWVEWSKYVLKELERLGTCYEKLERDIQDIHIEITKLKMKASAWGALAGMVPAIIVLIMWVIKNAKIGG